MGSAIGQIELDLGEQYNYFMREAKELEAKRLMEQRSPTTSRCCAKWATVQNRKLQPLLTAVSRACVPSCLLADYFLGLLDHH